MHTTVKCLFKKNTNRLCIVSLVRKLNLPHVFKLRSQLAMLNFLQFVNTDRLYYLSFADETIYNITFKHDPVYNLIRKGKSRLRFPLFREEHEEGSNFIRLPWV